jgi:hypothetical protein
MIVTQGASGVIDECAACALLVAALTLSAISGMV